jgi:CheY-like chemotaxis protein
MTAIQKILVIDDTLLVRAMVEAVLKGMGYDVRSAEDGRKGREVWAEWQPDLVFLDLTLPEDTGWEVLADMKATPEGKDTPVYILSGEDDAAAAREATSRGALGFIHKPFSSAQLLDAVTASIPSP